MNSYFGDSKVKKGTRKGVKANHPGERLVNVTNMLEKDGHLVCSEDTPKMLRVRKSVAQKMVYSGNWRFCPKNFKLEKA